MAKIDIKKSLGFTVIYNEGVLEPVDVKFRTFQKATIDDVREQLLNEELTYPVDLYTKYLDMDSEGIFESKALRINMYVMPPNLAGIEYVKTRAVKLNDFPKLLEIQNGGGIVIMQKLKGHEVIDVIVSRVKRDQKVIVPAGYALTLINTRQTPLIAAEVYKRTGQNKPVLDEVGGMAYYVIRKNAKQEVVRNPNYREVIDYRTIKWDELIKAKNITLKTPIAKQILRKYDKFKWLLKENSIVV